MCEPRNQPARAGPKRFKLLKKTVLIETKRMGKTKLTKAVTAKRYHAPALSGVKLYTTAPNTLPMQNIFKDPKRCTNTPIGNAMIKMPKFCAAEISPNCNSVASKCTAYKEINTRATPTPSPAKIVSSTKLLINLVVNGLAITLLSIGRLMAATYFG